MKKYEYDYPANRELGFRVRTGERDLIAELTGFSTSYVKMVLQGNRHNDTVIKIAKEIVETREAKIKELSNQNKKA